MKKKQIIALLMALIMCIGVLSGCTNNDASAPGGEEQKPGGEEQKSNEEQPKAEQILKITSNSEVTGLNPMLNTTAPDNGVHHMVLETLISIVADEEGRATLKPAVAKDWKVDGDGLVYTFELREDAKWNDGVSVTADDFVFTFQMMATPAVGSTNAWLFDGVIKNFEAAHYDEDGSVKPEEIGVVAIDEKTLEITLEKPCGYFLDLLNGAKPVRRDIYEKYGEEYGSTIDKSVFNGPFVLKSWDPNVQMTFTKNENHWDVENLKLEKVELKVIQEQSTAAQALLSGEIDLVSVREPEWRGMIEAQGGFYTIVAPSKAPEFFGFNVANKYFKNSKIRIAFALGYDRERFVSEINDGTADPLYTLMPSIMNVGDMPYHERVNGKNEIVKRLQEQYPDPKALLIEGLIEEGFDPDPAKMEVSLSTRGTTEFSKKIAEWMIQEWRTNLGVNVLIDMIEWNIMWDRVDAGDYDIATSGWGPYYNDPNGLLSIYHPVSGYFDASKSGWTGPDADKFAEILDKADRLSDNQERAELFLEAEELLVGTGVISPTYVNTVTYYVADHVNGYYINPHAYVDYSLITIGK